MQRQNLFFGAPKSLQVMTAAMKLKEACSFMKSYDQPRQHIIKQRHYFAKKSSSSPCYGFSSSDVWMWELDCKDERGRIDAFELWLLEKTLESPLDCKDIQPVHPKGN